MLLYMILIIIQWKLASQVSTNNRNGSLFNIHISRMYTYFTFSIEINLYCDIQYFGRVFPP